MTADSNSPTGRFTDRAAAYSAHRPGYPPQVFDVLFAGLGDSQRLSVADIGAGTGISSALLAQRVARVEAIEPNAAMRSRAQPHPKVRWHERTAEASGLAAKSVDVAAAFQAFHWFDAQKAFDEFMRIARRRIALVQYERDESADFSRVYASLVREYAIDDTEHLRARTLETFAKLAGARLSRVGVPFAQTLTLEGVNGRIDSSSYLPARGPAAARLRERVRAAFEAFQRKGTVEMATIVYVLTVNS